MNMAAFAVIVATVEFDDGDDRSVAWPGSRNLAGWHGR